MVLEAIEDHRRGFKGIIEGMGGERVARGKYHIEHVLPRKWQLHWPLAEDSEIERDRLVHSLGNVTLLTSRLNAKVSNSAWTSKRLSLQEHDVLKMNADLLAAAGETWNESKIRARTAEMIAAILEIWPVPAGHTSGFGKAEERPKHRVGLADLIAAGLLEPGTTVYVKRKAHAGRTATILSDGRVDVDGEIFDTPSGAARSITGKSENGWAFFRLSQTGRRSLSDLFQEYVDQTSADIDEDEVTDEGLGNGTLVFEDDDEDDDQDDES